jgi:tetratricopeptide (TPR) repeat protein
MWRTTRPIRRVPRVAAVRELCLPMLLLIAGLAGGCVSQERMQIDQAVTAYYTGNYRQAADLLKPLADKTNKNFVLNNLRLGSSLLAAGQLDDAQRAFLRAYEVINSLGVNDGGRTLGAILVSEDVKIWKGEPFERAMANFDLGLTYYIQHQYDNARGAFENALFKLQDYDSKGEATGLEESHFAPARLMLARAWQRLGRDDLAEQNFALVAKNHPQLAALANPSRNQQSNLLLVIAYGYGPRKIRKSDGDIVDFAPKPAQAGPIRPPRVYIDGKSVDLDDRNVPPVDLLALAQLRRWQSIDTIRTIKSAIGSGLMIAGLYQLERRNPQPGDAAAFLLAGLLMKGTSQADIRQWEMLPRTVFLVPLDLKPGQHDLAIEFPGIRQRWNQLTVPPEGEATYYFRIYPAAPPSIGRP